MHCMTVSLEQLALEMLRQAGFTDIEVRTVDGDVVNSDDIAWHG